MIVRSTELDYFLIRIIDFTKCSYKLKNFEVCLRISEEIRNAIKVKFIEIEKKTFIIFVSQREELILCNLETKKFTTLVNQNVVDFGWCDESEILVFKKNFEISLFNLKRMEPKDDKIFDIDYVKYLIQTVCFDPKFRVSKNNIFILEIPQK